MVKTMQHAGVFMDSTLVVLGWISFIGSFFVESPFAMFLLRVIARVLP
jgi:hypothetical protein